LHKFAISLAALAAAAPAAAQLAPAERAPLERPALPGFLREAPRPGFVLPPAPREPDSRISQPIRVVVSRFRISGATVFPAAELEALLAPFTGRPIGNDELEEARLAITRHYAAAGYLNSGAVLPDQRIGDGIVEIRVVEGRLADIAVSGANAFRPGFVAERMALAAGPPLNVNRLQERMQVLLQNPQFERINAELGPGLVPGEAVLRMDVTEARQNTVGFSYANNRSPAVGANRFETQAALRNKLGFGEALSLRFGVTDGMDDYGVSAAIPVSARDTLLTLKWERTDAAVVEAPFNLIDIQNRSRAFEAGVSHPLVRSVSRDFSAGATLAYRSNASTLLGQPFSFIPGLADGRSVMSALRLVADWSERGADHVFAARLTASHGLDALDATVNPGFPDSRFDSRLAQFQWARRLAGDRGQVLVRADWQRANGSLLPAEKFAVGGAQSVRGYRENALVRDHGHLLSVEYRRPVGRIAFPPLEAGPEAGQLEAAVFADTGTARDDGEAAQRLSSWGVGLRWTPAPGMLAQIFKGFPRQKLQNPTRSLADRGIHFSIAVQTQF
jgi:hemolysin activation/secretion protein